MVTHSDNFLLFFSKPLWILDTEGIKIIINDLNTAGSDIDPNLIPESTSGSLCWPLLGGGMRSTVCPSSSCCSEISRSEVAIRTAFVCILQCASASLP